MWRSHFFLAEIIIDTFHNSEKIEELIDEIDHQAIKKIQKNLPGEHNQDKRQKQIVSQYQRSDVWKHVLKEFQIELSKKLSDLLGKEE